MDNKQLFLALSLTGALLTWSSAQAAAVPITKTLNKTQLNVAKNIALAINKNKPADVTNSFNSILENFILYEKPEIPRELAANLRTSVYNFLGTWNSLNKLENPAGKQFELLLQEAEKLVAESEPKTGLGKFANLPHESIQQIISYLPIETLRKLTQTSVPLHSMAEAELEKRDPLVAWLQEPKTINLIGHRAAVNSLAFSSDGMLLVSGSDDRTARLWDAKKGVQLPLVIQRTESVRAVAISSDGTMIASGGGDTVIVNNTQAGNQLLNISFIGQVKSVSFSPDGKMIAAVGDHNGILRTIKRQGPISELSIGRLVAFVSDEIIAIVRYDTIQLFNRITTKKSKVILYFPRLVGLDTDAFSPNVKLYATATSDKTILVWDVATGRNEADLKTDHTHRINAVAFASNNVLASGSVDKTIKIWDIQKQKIIKVLPQQELVTALAFSPDGRTLAAGFVDGTIKLVSVE